MFPKDITNTQFVKLRYSLVSLLNINEDNVGMVILMQGENMFQVLSYACFILHKC